MQINPQQFSVEAFQEQKDWIGKLFSPLNQFTGDIFRGLRNQITIKDNLFQEIKEIKWVNSASNYPLRFQTKFNQYPIGLTYISIVDNTLSSYSLLAPHVVWTWANGEVIISDISGLTNANTYTIKLLVIYG